MKKTALLMCLGLVAGNILAQDKKMCNAEAMINTPDVPMQKDFTNIGKVANVSILVETITDMSPTAQKLSALDLEYGYNKSGNSVTKSVLLDPDEVDNLTRFLQALTDTYFKMPAPTGDKEYMFLSKSGFEAGAYWSSSGWKVYVKIESHDNSTDVEFSKDDLMVFMSFIRQARTKMM